MEKQVQGQLEAWQERLRALQNLPPVLAIIWKSGERWKNRFRDN